MTLDCENHALMLLLLLLLGLLLLEHLLSSLVYIKASALLTLYQLWTPPTSGLRCAHLSLQLQAERLTLVLSLRFIKGSFTYVGVSLAEAPKGGSLGSMDRGSADVASKSQQAGLPQKMQHVLSEKGVYLPKGVSQDLAGSPNFLAGADQHRVAAGVWVRNCVLSEVLSHFMRHTNV